MLRWLKKLVYLVLGGSLYTVKQGDTLSTIAMHHYGDGNRYPEIFDANTDLLDNPNKIYPGQVLIIPRK